MKPDATMTSVSLRSRSSSKSSIRQPSGSTQVTPPFQNSRSTPSASTSTATEHLGLFPATTKHTKSHQRASTVSGGIRSYVLKMALYVGVFLATVYVILSLSFNSNEALSAALFKGSSNADCDKHGPDNSLPAQYDLPKLLNVEAYIGCGLNDSTFTENLQVAARDYPYSIAAFYSRLPSACASRPYVPHIREAFHRYGAHHKRWNVDRDVQLALKNDTLTIHVETNETDADPDNDFLNEVSQRATNFSRVLLVAGSADDKTAVKAVRTILERDHPRIIVHVRRVAKRRDDEKSVASADADAFVLSVAPHLLVHSGNRGALAALSNSDGVVYTTNSLEPYIRKDAFKWMIRDGGSPKLEHEMTESARQLRAMGPIKPTCCALEPYGRGDGQKIVCDNARAMKRKDSCWVLSIGCQNKWSFEMDVFNKTKCTTHVFDCTGDFTVPQELRSRVHLHKLCVGARAPDRPAFRTMRELIDFGSYKSGFRQPVAPALAKMDVEGWEYSAIRDMLTDVKQDSLLPEQMLVEIHSTSGGMWRGVDRNDRHAGGKYYKSELFMEEFFGNLSRRHYDLVHRADNPYCLTCSEVTLLHRSKAPLVTV